jgi:hypothetical protein
MVGPYVKGRDRIPAAAGQMDLRDEFLHPGSQTLGRLGRGSFIACNGRHGRIQCSLIGSARVGPKGVVGSQFGKEILGQSPSRGGDGRR